jgi:hypothetical protein
MKIYLAGKIAKNDWRHELVEGLRSTIDDTHERESSLAQWPILHGAIKGTHDYTGPYFISCDHGCYHGPNTHGVIGGGCDVMESPSRQATVDLCRSAIRRSDLVFAWVDTLDAYGTIAEIAFARAIGIPVQIAGPQEFGDMWFVYRFCSERRPDFDHGDPWHALTWYLDLGRLKSMPYQEYLRTDHWHDRRTVALERANNRCQVCNRTDRLQVHHRTYERRGEEQPEDLIVLCNSCHRLFHDNGKLAGK